MCVIVCKPLDVVLDKEIWKNCFDNNSDGAGFMWAENGQLYVNKGFFTFESFWEAFAPYQKQKCIVHFRTSSGGEKNAINCHPFLVNDGLGFAHNGIISSIKVKDGKSDTYWFNELIMKPLISSYPDIWFHKTAKFLIEEFIGFSKMAFMDQYGRIKIYNEEKGENDLDCWFSNRDYKHTYYTYKNHAGYCGYPNRQAINVGTTAKIADIHIDDKKELIQSVSPKRHDIVICDNCNSPISVSSSLTYGNVILCQECGECDISSINYIDEYNKSKSNEESSQLSDLSNYSHNVEEIE